MTDRIFDLLEESKEISKPSKNENHFGDGFHLTDLGNAQRLVERFGNNIRYCPLWGRWLFWNYKFWQQDLIGNIYQLAKTVVLEFFQESIMIESEDRKKRISHAFHSESNRSLKAMVSLAESEEDIPIMPSELDVDPYLLNVLNGTINLKTGELKPHRREDLITKICPVSYDPHAQCPTWDLFLARIMDGNQDLITFLQKMAGYTLTGDVSEQCLFIAYGTGSNGKSTFGKTILTLLGDYAKSTDLSTFLVKQYDRIPNDLAALVGTRYVVASEAESGRRMAESLIKQLTGGDKMTARFLHKEYFEFDTTFKIFLSVNHKPIIKGSDHAIWRRIKLIPFTVTIANEDQDKNLLAKLRTEFPGILRWCVEGCLAWQKKGLGTPVEVSEATEQYREEMDVIGTFLEECCFMKEKASVFSKDLYKHYVEWCETNGEKSLNQRNFGMGLKERGFTNGRGTAGKKKWQGIEIV